MTLPLEARNTQFSPASLTGPAGVPFRIAFNNADVAISHNVTITSDAGQLLFNKPPFVGPAQVTYDVPALTPGGYRLGCIVHPTMTGTLTIR